ncbi:MAG TPA: arsenite methyltransferase [Longimicrobiales bacterium]|nr:arsenite methyltransferase [Longimicrobiales bacterium]
MSTTHDPASRREAVRNRYARAAGGDGCCAPSCCGATSAEELGRSIGYTAEELSSVPAEANLGLGCGNPTAIASLREGETVLDLGSGAGIDAFLAAGRVGPEGRVIGVDMTPEMVERARANARAGSFANVDFRLGEIEALPVADQSVDVVISNCVLNLSADKERALREAYRVLRRGGRLVVSDMVSDLPVPDVLGRDLDAVAGCLPTPRERYLAEFRAAGFHDVRITSEKPYPASYILEEPAVRAYLAAHEEHRAELERFAGSISGAYFEATRS